MNEKDKQLLEELEMARESLAAVEPPSGAWRSALRSSFTGDLPLDKEALRATTRAASDGDGTLEDLEALRHQLKRASGAAGSRAVAPPTHSFRERMRAGFAGEASEASASPRPLGASVRTPLTFETEEIPSVSASPLGRAITGALAAAAAVLVMTVVQRSGAEGDTSEPTIPQELSAVDASTSEWSLVDASDPDSIALTPAGAAGASLVARLAAAETVDVGESALVLSSESGLDLALRSGGRLESFPFASASSEAEDAGVFYLANGVLMLRSQNIAESKLVISTHFGTVDVSGTLAVSSEEVGIILSVVSGSAIFTPTRRTESASSKDQPERYTVRARNVLVVPYPNSDPVVAGFDDDMCTRTDSLRLFNEDLQRFGDTGHLR